MIPEDQILYLSKRDIAGLALEFVDVITALEDALRLSAAGKILGAPKSSIWIGPGEGFQALSVVDTRHDMAALKWIGLVPPGAPPSINVNASILLSDTRTGEIRCFLDAQRATALRTAGISAIAGKHLARGDSRSIGFIGAGVQAQSHLNAFMRTLPALRTVRVHSARSSSATHFADRAGALGLEAHVVAADDVLAKSDVIVTTVPLSADFAPFLDAAATRPGAFVAAVDLARPWLDASLAAMDLTIIDDEAMKHAAKPGSFIPPLGQADATLEDLVSDRHAGRTNPEQRTLFVSGGSALADLAVARLIYQRAVAANVGQYLAR